MHSFTRFGGLVAGAFNDRLNMRFGELGQQELQQRSSSRFASSSHMVDKRKEPSIAWQVVRRDAARRTQPRPAQRPTAFHRLDVNRMNAIAVVIPCVFATPMTDRLVRITPRLQAAIDLVFIRGNTGTRRTRGLDAGLDRAVLDAFHQTHDHLTTPLTHPADRRCLGGKRPASPLALEPPAPSASPFVTTSAGWPW